MREFLGIKLEAMFLSKYQLKKLNRKERQEYLSTKKRYIRFQEALKTGMIKHIKNAHEFNKFQHEQDEHYLDDTYDKVINTNYSKIKKKEKKVDKIPVVREEKMEKIKRVILPPKTLPDGVTAYSSWFEYENERIFYDKIRSIRIYRKVYKSSMNLMPMPTQVSSILEIYLKNSTDKIKMKLNFQRFGFKRKKKDEQFEIILLFCRFIEAKTFENRLDYYLKTRSRDVLFQYQEQGIFKRHFDILKDGTIRKNGKDFASFDEEKYDISRSYKKIYFVKKKGFLGFEDKQIDISRDEDVFLLTVMQAFKLSIPFVERNEY